jgi:hypothetical protein
MAKAARRSVSPEDFASYLATLPADPYRDTHRLRYLETFRLFRPYLDAASNVVELGAASPICEYLRSHRGVEAATIETDLRQQYSFASGECDAVLSLEVLEHLNDTHSDGSATEEIAMFTASGARNMFAVSFRILAPGGVLLLTTPNAGSVDVLGNVLRKRHPFMYPAHVREYVIADVTELGTAAGFRLELVETFFAWNAAPDVDRMALLQFLARNGFGAADRGNDAAFAFRKPAV